jgi:hypothetical protein
MVPTVPLSQMANQEKVIRENGAKSVRIDTICTEFQTIICFPI